MKKLTKLISLLLMLTMLLSLAACNKDDSTNSNDPTSNSETSEIKSLAEELGYGYVATYSPIPEGYDNINTISYQNGRYYMMAYSWDEETYVSSNELISMNPDGSDLQSISLPQSEEGIDRSYNNFQVDKDGNLWLLVYEYYYPVYEEGFYDEDIFVDAVIEEAIAEDGVADGEIIGAAVTEAPAMEVVTNAIAIAEPAAPVMVGEDESFERYMLYKCDPQGNVLLSTNLSELKAEDQDYIWFNQMVLDSNSNIYLTSDQTIYAFDSELNPLFDITSDSWINSMIPTNDGKIICTYWGENGMEISPIDVETKTFGESYSIPNSNNLYNLLPAGDTSYDFFTHDGNVLYGYEIDTNTLTPILNWLDCDINGNNAYNMCAISDKQFTMLTYDEAVGTQVMVTLDQVPFSELPVREIITYAYTDYLDYNIRSAILSFNRQNTTYRISTVDYSQYNTNEDYTVGDTRLGNDILAGKVPDMVDASNFDITAYADKGVFLDLYTLIDSDSEVNRDFFVDGILKNLETDGKLYSIANSFYIQTAMGLSDVVGDYPGWTFDEMMAAYSSLEGDAEIMRYMTRSSFLSYCIRMGYDNYVDRTTGQCNFNGEDFVKLLEVAAAFPEEFDYNSEDNEVYVSDPTRLYQRQVLLCDVYLSTFNDLDWYRAYLQGQDFTLVGFPCSTKNGHMMSWQGQLSVSATSTKTDGAWQFIKYLLSEEYQENSIWNFSVNKAVFDKKMKEAMEPPYYLDENGEKVEYENSWYLDDGTEIVLEPMTEADVQKVLDVIANAGSSYQFDETINNIITEETASFFDGQKTAQQVADLIQNRVQTYIMENM